MNWYVLIPLSLVIIMVIGVGFFAHWADNRRHK